MRIRNRAELQRVRLTKSPFSCNGSVNVVARTRHGDEMGSLVSDTQSALPRHRARCNRKPGNGTRAVFVAISGTSASRERFQRVSTRLTRTHLYLRSETLFSLCPPPWTSGHHCHWTLYFSFVFISFFFVRVQFIATWWIHRELSERNMVRLLFSLIIIGYAKRRNFDCYSMWKSYTINTLA